MDFAASNFDFEESYLRRILGFMGLTDVTFIHAEYQMRSEKGDPVGCLLCVLIALAPIPGGPVPSPQRPLHTGDGHSDNR